MRWEKNDVTTNDNGRVVNAVDAMVGRKLRSLRLKSGLNPDAFARSLDLSFSQLHKYELGANRISAAKLYDISVRVDVPLTWFFEADVEQAATVEAPSIVAEPPKIIDDGAVA